ncbi:alkanesulfonate monooxygenase SsuD/methylene tetrahydromethanopterin reductase-like flavin-dependent oxidoreductase (luciferase family) [Ilumatobacter fluminis]|uniref:Alkanesulfonate monooxygenase SsuD/methylene tetrahydromethanopterin reductase-like flavin-dependent oxidoreductase (Luciferase family) n=1 Tax=Ilumatobacter fluminis TaxID=467091 RepID=A0A4R7I385_9ACTN|nr:LLM class flavin-dependent oxidoreductase [Ilumatobacter fluminis]TDT17700.1 alkanesulfonate monooxygenase SsuD/methylene tetrahydromethanopterin reductase-like flavin-dependent oxidoreductase (luciferase family) [Ilumatobacter fluminis]
MQLGVHIGQQNLSMDELRDVWRRADAAGADWISVWDHLYEAPPAGGTIDHFEAVACLGALAAETTNARLGCLVFYVGYRNPGLLAKAAVTIDHISGGRFELGIGAGWHEWEAAAYGYDFPPVGRRLDMLDEAAGLLTSYFTNDRTTHEGEYFRASDASMLPGPVRGHLPIWVGGVGEKRTLRMAAQYADGWNAAYVSPAEYRRLNGVLDEHATKLDRDPSTIERSINLMFDLGKDEAELETQWGAMWSRVREGSLHGSVEQASERIAEYRDAGAGLVNVALRAPVDHDLLDAYLTEIAPALRTS